MAAHQAGALFICCLDTAVQRRERLCVLLKSQHTMPVPPSACEQRWQPAELWDPATEEFTLLNGLQGARTYHSVAVLLPDGRVFSGGGGLCGETCFANHPDGEVRHLMCTVLFYSVRVVLDGAASCLQLLTTSYYTSDCQTSCARGRCTRHRIGLCVCCMRTMLHS